MQIVLIHKHKPLLTINTIIIILFKLKTLREFKTSNKVHVKQEIAEVKDRWKVFLQSGSNSYGKEFKPEKF